MEKRDAVKRYGASEVDGWRRGFRGKPPPAAAAAVSAEQVGVDKFAVSCCGVPAPQSESLEDVYIRIKAYFEQHVKPQLAQGKTVMVVTHSNAARAFLMILDGISTEDEEKIVALNVPNAIPLVYEFDTSKVTPTGSKFLAPLDEWETAVDAVARQCGLSPRH